MGLTTEQLMEAIDSMTVRDLAAFVEALKDKYGVTAAVPAAAPAAGGGDAAPVAEEKDTFDVILTSAGDKKIQVIKVVREITSLGLKEAKDLVDTAPQPVRTGVKKEEADSIKAKLEEQGASVELK
ncbi:MAG TPA: 50S ribosomal protein L7/L12 [Armatimonadota bacterium]